MQIYYKKCNYKMCKHKKCKKYLKSDKMQKSLVRNPIKCRKHWVLFIIFAI